MKKLLEIRDALNARFLERGEAIEAMLVALVSRQMMFFLGLPGTGKSDMCGTLCESIDGKYFNIVVSKTTKEEEILGPFRMSGLAQDKFVRNTENRLPEATIGFIDEIWKCNSAVGNTLLPITNERKFFNDGKMHDIPLQVLFTASNELPQGEELGAMWDRMALRVLVNPLQDDANVLTMLAGGEKPKLPKLSIKELEAEQAKAQKLEVSEEAMNVLLTIRREIKQQGIYVSDRKWVQAARIVKAHAYLRGHKAVQAEDLDILQHVLWNNAEQIPQVRKLVYKHCNPVYEQLVEHQDAIAEINKGITKDSKSDWGVEQNSNLKAIIKILNKLKKENPNVAKIDELIQYADRTNRKIAEVVLGLS
jgi:MoxR-like ATPase